MTQQKWEPGTVAMDIHHTDVNAEGPLRFQIGGVWVDTDCDDRYPPPCDIRPLLVLDPDNPDQMDRLLGDFFVRRYPNGSDANMVDRRDRDAFTLAVRAMLPKPTPVKPAEPTGLGAVVEDADGKWVCLDNSRLPWREWTSGEFRDWADFSNAVKVLSEGVTP